MIGERERAPSYGRQGHMPRAYSLYTCVYSQTVTIVDIPLAGVSTADRRLHHTQTYARTHPTLDRLARRVAPLGDYFMINDLLGSVRVTHARLQLASSASPAARAGPAAGTSADTPQ